MEVLRSIDDFKFLKERLVESKNSNIPTLIISAGTCGQASGANDLIRIAKGFIIEKNLVDKINLRITGCHGFCEMEPSILVESTGVFYPKLQINDIKRVVEATSSRDIVEDLLFIDPSTDKRIPYQNDIPFFKKQMRTILGRNEKVDPIRLFNYFDNNGYSSLVKVLEKGDPGWVLNEIKQSGLRGRGGAGFPTGIKWEMLANRKSDKKFIVCNADEGDPGAYMDRSVLEGNPHSIIEGMLIGAYATGATEGVIYVRNEYPLAIKHLIIALRQAKDIGLLGNNILDSGFSFDIKLVKGAGAFVCGEETALIGSIEGKIGEPHQRPPFPVEHGIDGKPTIINNVETWANVSIIIDRGAEEFSKIGTKKSPGTKIFSLVGKVKYTGLVEVPMGMTIKEIVYDIGGGPVGNSKIKAIQTGGPSGGCIPAELFDLTIDYESLNQAGAIMGSGGMIVMDDNTCMVNLAKYFMNFLKDESCGKCFTCRKGTQRMYEILDDITKGNGTIEQISLLEELANVVKDTTLCGLGQTSANPILSTLRYFKDEYMAHILDHKCKATVCHDLFYAPCQNTCPAGVDVARYIACLTNGDLEKAFWIHMENNPFPAVCSRICPSFCETKCRRGQTDEPVSIREIKRVFADYAVNSNFSIEPPKKIKNQKVAIIGSGPAGLSCAYYLTRLGYKPTVFEAMPVAGGMMAICIPEYRLPKDILQKEIKRIQNAGVDIKLSSPIKSVNELLNQGFDAVFIATGDQQSKKLDIEGEEKSGVISGIDFLRRLKQGEKLNIGKKVIIVGGGYTAMDAARTALRLGAEEVRIVYRRTREEMPAQEEINEAMEEGVKFDFLVSPVKIEGKDKVASMSCVQNRLGGYDNSGRRKPVKIDGSEFTMQVDTVIPCLGQEMSAELDLGTIQKNKDGFIKVDPHSYSTNIPGVFAGGDVLLSDTVVTAVGHGKKAAQSIDRYFGNSGEFNFEERTVIPTDYNEEDYANKLRVKPNMIELKERICIMDKDINKGLSLEVAQNEAKRCLRCDREIADEE